jgi:rhodanese-related sulfurtransferase
MKKLTLLLFVAALGVACNQTTNAQSASEVIAPAVFQAKINELNDEIIIDVRTEQELGSGFIQDALFIDFKSTMFKTDLAKLDKSKPVMVYCASGGRSGKTAKLLAELGFTNVYDLEGGMGAWKAANMDINLPE